MNNKPLLTLVVIFAFEALFPHYRRRQSRIKHAFPHILTAIMNGLLMKLVLVGLTNKAIGSAENNPWGLMHMLSLSLNTVTVIVLVLFDVWMYFWHIINHRLPFLWRFHRAHHSDIAMDTTTALHFLRVFIVTPNMHRVHHSVERTETNSNFASLLSVWDRLNRTFKMREDTRTITTGLPLFREQQWQRLLGFMITPLSEDGTG